MRKTIKTLVCSMLGLSMALAQNPQTGKVVRIDPRLDELVSADAKIEKIADGFAFTEGPLWSTEGNYLLFTDIPKSLIYKWQNGEVSVFRDSTNRANGLTFDMEGRLIVCEEQTRCISRIEKDGTRTVLAATYKGKKFNSPNDVIVRSDGTIYFTDPPYGLPKADEDTAKQLPYNGIYRIKNGVVTLEEKGMYRPNGIAFSPDESYIYIGNLDSGREVWATYDVTQEGSFKKGFIFFDATNYTVKGNPDGLKVDSKGNVYATGPDGIWVLSPEGEHLGGILFPEMPSNCAWGDADGKTLYVTARTGIYRIRMNVAGILPGPKPAAEVIGNKK
ncbi:SMP-30/gluconolactonase/LRE family protein [Cytophagaceae bacterium DM2B3-1]|uniref:SMP-30/gluconolactonase/LRE family protein n=1 Tax=Xanthocytophaga flava TaxID=3048013 RepID=A0ABT7CT25_9BACT|nr:SMP-30/gluconolactonase/LRE family protein [Xanthocytophaga flavus]MDJ1496877.1 SMP-30/gluconolactonase/LRE family protein [Xanthocytophaga flavus]